MATSKSKAKPGPNGKMSKSEVAALLAKHHLAEGTFEIDKNPPTMAGRYTPPEFIMLREKVRRTVEATPTDKAFIVPALGLSVTKKLLKEEFPKYKFVFNHVVGNDKAMRVYKLKGK